MRTALKATVFVVAVVASSVSCAAPAPPGPHAHDGNGPAEESSPLDAFWVAPSTSSFVGPAIDGGTWAVLGGRRLLLRTDGSTGVETHPTREVLTGLAAVPTAGDHARRLFGVGRHAIYAFDDALGSGRVVASFAEDIERIAAGPGLLFVWVENDQVPRVLDAVTGAPSPAWTQPVLDVAFVDIGHGAAIFVGAGLAVTSDGGTTWRPVGPPERRGKVKSVAQVAGIVRASPTRMRSEWARGGEVDIDAATLSEAPGTPGAPAGLALGPRERWILEMSDDATFDPLELGVLRGADLGDSAALVAARRRLVRMDLATGLAVDVEGTTRPELSLGDCTGTRARDAAWFKCSGYQDGRSAAVLFRAPIDRPSELEIVFRGRSWGEMYTTSAGGLAISPCDREDDPTAARSGSCVLQPDGRFAFVALPSNAGAARDGAVYSVDTRAVASHYGQIRAYYPDGHDEAVARIDLPMPLTRFESLDEDADGTFHVLLGGESGLYAVEVKRGGEARSAVLDGVTSGAFRAGHGWASGPDRTLTSRDGLDWSPVAPPPAFLVERHGAMGLVVTSMGVEDVSGMLRVHWGDGTAIPEPDPVPILLVPGGPRPPAPYLECTRGAGVGSAGIDDKTLMEEPASVPGELRSMRRFGGAPFAGPTRLAFTEIATDQPGATPTRWEIRWLDGLEIGAHVRTWTGPTIVAAWSTRVLGMAGRAGEIAFGITFRGRNPALVRIDAAGHIDVRDTGMDLLPISAMVFGSDKRASLAWLAADSLVVWPRGGDPRKVASLATTDDMVVTSATDTSVEILSRWGGDVLRHTFDLGAPKAGVGAVGVADATLAWTKTAAPFEGSAYPPACPKGSNDPLFAWPRQHLPDVAIDGEAQGVSWTSFLLRATPTGDCAESALVEMALNGEDRFLRLDLARGVSEVGKADPATPNASKAVCTGW